MIYSIVVGGFDNDNDYCHDCDLIEAKSFQEAFAYATNWAWQGWTFTKIEIEILKEYQYIIQYHDNYTNENELDAKIKFRLRNDFSDTKRYTIISVKGVKK